jgi:phosphatidylglycerophosphate synthase
VGASYLLKAAGVFAVVMAVALPYLRTHHPHGRFGTANSVTTARAALVALLAALIGDPAAAAVATPATMIASVAAVLDGVDGWLARRSGMMSRFGSRFDMEVDALLVMVLATLAWQYEKAGAWVMLSGLLRYLFVAAGWLWPWFRRALEPSLRRKAVCVVQIVGLIFAIAPVIEPPLSNAIAALSLAVLAWSFALDVRWLWGSRAT